MSVDSKQKSVQRDSAKLLSLLESSPSAYQLFSALDNEMFLHSEGKSCSIMTVSSRPGEGKSTIALLMSLHVSRLSHNDKVLLVDADNGECGLKEYLQLDSGSDPTVEKESADWRKSIQATSLQNVDYVSAGACSTRRRLDYRQVQTILAAAKQEYDMIIVDPPAANISRDMFTLATLVDYVIVATEQRGPRRQQVQVMVEELNRVGAKILGAVLTNRRYHLPRWLYGS